MNEQVRESQIPRYAIFVYPVDTAERRYRVRVRKGWWGGPGRGVTGRDILDRTVTLDGTATEELETVMSALLGAIGAGGPDVA